MKKYKKIILIIGGMVAILATALYAYMTFVVLPKQETKAGKSLRKNDINPQFSRYVIERFGDGLKKVELIRRDNKITYRIIKTGKGKERVSVVDGFRILYAYPNTKPIAKVIIEKSKEGEYENDRKKVLNQLKYLSRGQKEVVRRIYKGVVYHSLDSDALSKPIVGLTVMFFPEDQIIGTVHFLFEESEKSKFYSYKEYQRLRNKFIIQYIGKIPHVPNFRPSSKAQ